MHEDPLHLIPHHLRDDFFDEYGVRIEGTYHHSTLCV